MHTNGNNKFLAPNPLKTKKHWQEYILDGLSENYF